MLSLQIDDYLQEVVVTEDDPGLLLEWDEAAVDAFVIIANTGIADGGGPLPAHPAWITSAPGAMSRATFTNDVVTYCAAVAGGRVGVVLIAPNDFRQYHLVTRSLAVAETDGFVQGCMAQLAAYPFLARLFYLADKTSVRAQPLQCAARVGFRTVFA